jgi:choline-glycine betaine transporter
MGYIVDFMNVVNTLLGILITFGYTDPIVL